MSYSANMKFTEEHEWIVVNGDIVTVGITDFAQQQLGDIVYIEIDTVGENLAKGDVFGTIEAVKTVSDLFMPLGGEVVEVNSKLSTNPEIVNKDPHGEGWMIKIKISNPDELNALMDVEAYKAHIG